MHKITIPEPVKLIDPRNGKPLLDESGKQKIMTLFDLICDVAFSDRKNFGEGWKSALALNAIHSKFVDVKPGDVVEIETEHYERLSNSLLCLSAGTDRDNGIRYEPKLLFQLLPLLKAIKEAEQE